ncbi:MAG: PQQ-binding-like beta-propeller repeat protein [Phycisphaerales bacterium]
MNNAANRSGIAPLMMAAGMALAITASGALAQVPRGTVFVDDSTAAQSTLRALPSLIRAGNEAEAVRVLQASLESGAERLVPVEGDPDLFVSVRDAVHERLLAEPELLERYRLEHSTRAERLIAEARFAEVERSYLLTPSGYEAALLVARERFGLARFHSSARVLAQLDRHPDRATDGGRGAELLSLVAAQLDVAELREWAAEWRVDAGLPEADWDALRIEPPEAVLREDASPVIGGQTPPLLPDEVPWAQPFDEDLAPGPGEELPEPPPIETRGGAFWILPKVAGDTILINDGGTLSAWDRFSLRLRWRASLIRDQETIEDLAEFRKQAQTWRSIESPSSVAVDARAAYASMGLHLANTPDLESGILAVDLESGATLWNAQTRSIDPRYPFADVQGELVAGEGRVVLGMREDNRAGRQLATALVGLDALTGEPAWVRTLGSTGTGWSRSTRSVGAGGVIADGVIYWFEPLGVVAALDAHDGRPIWLRRFEPEVRGGRGDVSGAWNGRAPIVTDGNVIALVNRSVYRFDRQSGALLGTAPTSQVGAVDYLVHAGDRIAAVGQSTVRFFEPEAINFDRSAGAFPTAPGFSAPVTGRALAVDDLLLVPSSDVAVLLDPATGLVEGPVRALPRPGSVVSLSDQIIVADSAVLQSVMSADVAVMALTERLQDDPNDFASLVSLVLLAERRQILDAVPGAAERALEALAESRQAGEDALRIARAESRRLFEALLSMVHQMVELDADNRDDALADELSRLTLRAAPSTAGRARALLTIGQLSDRQGRGAQAAEAYLDVLADEGLRLAPVAEEGPIAGVLATQRLKKLLPLHGYEIIEPHEAGVSAQLAEAAPGSEGDASRLEAAARVPASISAMRAYERVAEIAEQEGNTRRASRAWRRALDVARLVRTSGGPVAGTDVARLGANLARVLTDSDHLAAAGRIVRQLRPVSPIERIEAPDIGELARRFADRDRGARFGARPSEVTQRLDGWSLMQPVSSVVDPALPEHVVLGAGHVVGVWALAPDLGPIEGEPFEADPKGPLELVWTGTHDPSTPPTLLRQDRERALLVWQGRDGVELRSVSLFDGTAWNSGPMVELFDEADREPRLDGGGARIAALMATGQQADPMGWIVASDGDHVALARRDGLLAILDARTGEALYSGRPGIGTVMDVAVAGGRVWAMGSVESPGSGTVGALETLGIWGFTLDGSMELERVGLSEPPRWIAAADDGTVVVGPHSSVAKLRADATQRRGVFDWQSEDDAAFNATLGWVLGDTLAVMSSRGDLALARLSDGKFGDRPLILRLIDGEVPRLALQGDRLVALTSGGVTVLAGDGDVLGRDALRSTGGRNDDKLPPALGDERALLVPRRSFSISGGQGEYIVSTVTTESAKVSGTRTVRLPEPPIATAVVDGYGLISTGQRTLVLRFE